MADQDKDLVDVDLYDPGDGSLPVFRWKQAGHVNLATRRQQVTRLALANAVLIHEDDRQARHVPAPDNVLPFRRPKA
ncbi:hypothetical protein [Streptomyces rochei]|uniref:hypothetical protein n=1 Tax=Streptomyces rochei TaxID=1928 RepID=UPI002799E1F3|nr:hypothetical protein [Streptomyces rochei]WDI23320.1 hypothetical protein PS783_37450 [Streptomyces enissocaesilis]WMI61891.1 hypothetical protein RBH85_36110 [Streptomyces rochei]